MAGEDADFPKGLPEALGDQLPYAVVRAVSARRLAHRNQERLALFLHPFALRAGRHEYFDVHAVMVPYAIGYTISASMFKDRNDAGKQLAKKLEAYAGKDAVVLALPRGGVVVGYEAARALSLPLDIIAVRKVGHPSQPEYAIGAVADDGTFLLNEEETRLVSAAALQKEIAKERAEARRRGGEYRSSMKPVDIEGKTALIVDDGIATGLTMRLAVRIAKARGAKRVIAAVPVAPHEAVRDLEEEGADKVVVLLPPEAFEGAVGAHYERFEQVGDEEVIKLLQSAHG